MRSNTITIIKHKIDIVYDLPLYINVFVDIE